MNARRIVLGGIAAALLALAASLGYFMPRAEASTVVYSLRVNPGGAYGWLTCTWHSACTSNPPPPGRALDWGREGGGAGGSSVYWRSWGYRSDTGSYSTIGYVSTAQNNGTCKRTSATVRDNLNNLKGRVDYTHTEGSSSWFYIPGNYNNYYLAVWIASVASDELWNCKNAQPPHWTAPHLHQDDGTASFTLSSGFTVRFMHYSQTGINDWMYYQAWFY